MFSAVLSSGLSLENTSLPLSMNLLSYQKVDENSEIPFQLISLGIQLHLHDLYLAILLAVGYMSN